MDKHGKMKAILREAPYCPICYYVNQEMKRQYRWLFIEYSHSNPFIMNLVKGGLCQVHSLEIMKHMEGQDMSLCYSYLVKYYRHKLGLLLAGISIEQKPQSFFETFFGKKDQTKNLLAAKESECPFCKSQKLFQDGMISDLLEALAEPEVLELYKKSPGLCRAHLEQALDEGERDVKKLLVQLTLEKIDQISADFEEYFHKLDYRYSNEPKGEEQNAWLRAMRFYDSYITLDDAIDDPKPQGQMNY